MLAGEGTPEVATRGGSCLAAPAVDAVVGAGIDAEDTETTAADAGAATCS